MLWIDGHIISGKAAKEDKNLEIAAEIVNDWNCFAIKSGTRFVFNQKKRFQMGYHFAAENAAKLAEHAMLSGNRLTIVAFGKSIAFAEGVAAFLYAEKRIKVHQAIYAYGSQLNKTPQWEDAVKYRIIVGQRRKNTKNIRFNSLLFKSINIEERKLPGNYFRYNIFAFMNNGKYPIGFFIHKNKGVRFLSRRQPVLFWDAVSHSIKMLETADSIFDFDHSPQARVHGLFDLSYN